MFQIDKTLEADSVPVATLALCRVRLIRDAAYPWLILVPARARMRDIDDLAPADQGLLTAEISLASRTLKALFVPDKINVAALGNVVEQLHVHVIARFKNDAAWPRPVWGVAPMRDDDTLHEKRRRALQTAFARHGDKDSP
ncbi:HIT domain-containing protein [Varunaivibrio sulfuroxidans]|uniref:Diadenosine tetraphosphate (Ap4A) HIT family hydrolase n=1 Tax=Varunaivibrio sulfuroxidans TaxID=1773489 RepID=A0A4R3JBD2_9PROT|nr:HIT family protein [Varunaivibrio sulfuroxidans]TCS62934.1 diadenosine tetraphosphate (Ap4A) HIT family hydrolase [Varunaivibrio sulfuroxidans]WES31990.1 HIT family protein [Varunaivibrio sulfuroxidans]